MLSDFDQLILAHVRRENEELRRENAVLRMQVFWKDHMDTRLIELFQDANDAGPRCRCPACVLAGRAEKHDIQQLQEGCAFVPWMDAKVAECGLTSAMTTTTKNLMKEGAPHMCADYDSHVYDVDAHFHHSGGDTVASNWHTWVYGARLWKASSIKDPELQRLRQLFQTLQALVAASE